MWKCITTFHILYSIVPYIFTIQPTYLTKPFLLQSTHNRLHDSWSEAATLARTIYLSVSAFLSMSYSFVARCRLSNKLYIKIKLNFYIFLSLAAVTRSMWCRIKRYEMVLDWVYICGSIIAASTMRGMYVLRCETVWCRNFYFTFFVAFYYAVI